MKQVIYRLLACGVMVFSVTATNVALAEPSQAASPEGSFCLDSMETVPIDDDLVPTPIAVDGGCMVSEAVVSI
jgi:hypothetical protein